MKSAESTSSEFDEVEDESSRGNEPEALELPTLQSWPDGQKRLPLDVLNVLPGFDPEDYL